MNTLAERLHAELDCGPVAPEVISLGNAIRDRFGSAVRAILLYGSCRREHSTADGLVDLLVVVDRYRSAYGLRPSSGLNWLLPPNVYYLECPCGETTVRCKYAVISAGQFSRRVASRLDHYFWARFSQPIRRVYLRDPEDRSPALARARAVANYARRIQPLLDKPEPAIEFWTRALRETYRCELRPERPQHARRLIEQERPYWQQITSDLIQDGRLPPASSDPERIDPPHSVWRRRGARGLWSVRRPIGKLFNLARLFKAAGTFSNGIDYLVWKVERHSGVRIEPSQRMRRWPRLAAWGLLWRLWRRGGFR